MKLTQISDLTFVPAYKKENTKRGKVYGLSGIRKKAGVYFIKENGTLVYIGMSRSNLLEALYRHFQNWQRSKTKRINYLDLENYTYEIACITTPVDDAHPMEKAYILMYDPRDNRERYEKYAKKEDFELKEVTDADGIYLGEQYAVLPF